MHARTRACTHTHTHTHEQAYLLHQDLDEACMGSARSEAGALDGVSSSQTAWVWDAGAPRVLSLSLSFALFLFFSFSLGLWLFFPFFLPFFLSFSLSECCARERERALLEEREIVVRRVISLSFPRFLS